MTHPRSLRTPVILAALTLVLAHHRVITEANVTQDLHPFVDADAHTATQDRGLGAIHHPVPAQDLSRRLAAAVPDRSPQHHLDHALQFADADVHTHARRPVLLPEVEQGHIAAVLRGLFLRQEEQRIVHRRKGKGRDLSRAEGLQLNHQVHREGEEEEIQDLGLQGPEDTSHHHANAQEAMLITTSRQRVEEVEAREGTAILARHHHCRVRRDVSTLEARRQEEVVGGRRVRC